MTPVKIMKNTCRHLLIAPSLLWLPAVLADSLYFPQLPGKAKEVREVVDPKTQKDLQAAREKNRQLEEENAKLKAALKAKPEVREVKVEVVKPDPKTEKALQAAQEEIGRLKAAKKAKAEIREVVTADPRMPQLEAENRELKQKLSRQQVAPPASSPAAAATPQCTVCPELVELPRGSYKRGSYKRGSSPKETGHDDDEGPVKTVTIDYRLAVGKYAVSFAEWDACRADGGCTADPTKTFGGGKQPVINVTWSAITQQYIPWLNRKAGFKPDDPYRFRLLSEAEREYAARGVTRADAPHPPFPQIPGARFADGRCLHTDDANYNGNYDYGNCGAKTGVYRKGTLAVDSLRPNNFGLYHMAGNVWEWVADCYVANYDDAKTDGSAYDPPASSCKSGERVLRGGSCFNSPSYLRAAYRFRFSPDNRNDAIGFRLARMLPP